MTYQPYPSCKPSGIEWLGEIPEDWQVRRGRYQIRVNPRSTRLRELSAEDDVSFVPMESVGEYGGLDLQLTRSIDEIAGASYTEFEDGDVVVAKITPCFENGKGALASGLLNGAAYATTELHVLRALPVLEPRFLFYLTISTVFRSRGQAEMYGASGQKRVPPEFVQDFPMPMPPVREQEAIAAFLDRETGRIDDLVAKERSLIEKLNEKRGALISLVVTRGLPAEAACAAGLDQHPRLKPSGVEWLGDVPEHWEVEPLKFVARVGNGSTPNRDRSDYWADEGYPWLNSSVVNLEEVTQAEEFVTELALRECHLPKIAPPAVLIGITGEGRTRGMAATLRTEATINQHVVFVKPITDECQVAFLRRVFDRAYQYLRNESDGGGSTKGAITCEQIGNLMVPVPPCSEQQAIADYLESETTRIDQLAGKVEEAIDRLQEYRGALITAAVTGKIDVRRLGSGPTARASRALSAKQVDASVPAALQISHGL